MSCTYDATILKAELTNDEGIRLDVYKDSLGYLTVGIGHNLSIRQSAFTVDALYQNDINGCEASLDVHFPWWRSLDPVRQRVMMNMVFNLGSAGLSTFTHTLAAIQSGNYEAAAQGMLTSTWARQVGARATRLAAMMRSGAVALSCSTTENSDA